jgi:hypothetical protein
MRSMWQRSRTIAIAVVIVLGAGAIALARPHPISEPVLGTEWQCSRAAFVVTCNHRRDGAPDPDAGVKPTHSAINDEGVLLHRVGLWRPAFSEFFILASSCNRAEFNDGVSASEKLPECSAGWPWQF